MLNTSHGIVKTNRYEWFYSSTIQYSTLTAYNYIFKDKLFLFSANSMIIMFGKHAMMSYFRVFSVTRSNVNFWPLVELHTDQWFSTLGGYLNRLGTFSKLRFGFQMGSVILRFQPSSTPGVLMMQASGPCLQ